nr:TetR-like C-terminal domain-containing protein [Solimonas marina]
MQLAVCVRALLSFRERHATAAAAADRGYDKIIAIGRAYMRFANEQPLYFAALSRFEAHRPETLALGSSERAVLDVGYNIHELTVGALQHGMRDGSIRQLDDPLLVAITLWSYTHGAIQVAQTKGPFLEEAGIATGALLDHAIELAMRGLAPDTDQSDRPT